MTDKLANKQKTPAKKNAHVGTPYAVKVSCTVWTGGKGGDKFKALPICIKKKVAFFLFPQVRL
jgi:hypothetical protein